MLRKLLLCVLVLAVAPVLALAGTTGVDKLPDQVMAVVEIGDVVALGNSLANAVRQIDPTQQVPPLGMMAPMFLMKTADPSTVDLTKPSRLVVLAPPLHMSPVFVFSVTDAQRYTDTILPNVKKLGERDGIGFYQEGGSILSIGARGNYGALSPEVDAVEAVLTMMEDGGLPAGRLIGDGDVGVVGRVGAVLEALTPVGMNPFDMARSMLIPQMTMNAPPGQEAQMEATAQMLGIMLDGVESVLNDTEGMSIALALGDDALEMTWRLDPVAGSGLEGYIASIPRDGLNLLSRMPADTALIAGVKLGDMKPLYDWGIQIMTGMVGAGVTTDAIEQIRTVYEQLAAATGDEMAWALSYDGQGGPKLVMMQKVNDPQAARRLAEESLKTMANLMADAGTPTGMGMSAVSRIETNVAQHGGHEIDAYVFELPAPAADQFPDPQMAAMMAQVQNTVFDVIFGTDRRAYVAYLDDMSVFTMGPGALDTMKAAIDNTGTSAVQAYEGGPGAGQVCAGSMSLSGLANFGLGIGSEMGAAMGQQMPFAGIEFPDAPPVTFATWVDENHSIEDRTRVPLTSIRAIIDGAKALQTGMQPFNPVP